MRMRLKKHLEERIADCGDILIAREGYEFYKLTDEQKQMQLDLQTIFGNDNPLYLELGCGKGSFAIKSAKLHPERNYLALEKLSNVIVVGCEDASKENLSNLRFMNCHAENLRYYLADKSVTEIILNFSCPFPKKTYANRRMTSKNYLEVYKHLLADGGIIRQKTDDLAFFEWSMESYKEHGYEVFDVTYDLPEGGDNVMTEYEEKFRTIGKKIYACKARLKQ